MKHLRKFDSVSEMDTAIASSEIGILGLAYDGSTPVVKIKVVEPAPGPVVDPTVPFYVENITNENETLNIVKSADAAPTLEIEYSTDKTTWQTLGTTSTTALTYTLQAGDKIYLRCSTNSWYGPYSGNTITGVSKVGGNIMSLLYGNNFTGQETNFASESTDNLSHLFYNNTILIDASNLLLPATTLAQSCYHTMFQGCTSLTSVPTLPATTLADYCCDTMFQGCTSLTSAPTLPATTLAEYCYAGMFQGCTSLTSAPALPATTLAKNCYKGMFKGCANLNYIKCLATDISARNCTNDWTNGVAASGTFVKDPNMSGWATGVNGIPNGWTVQDATA